MCRSSPDFFEKSFSQWLMEVGLTEPAQTASYIAATYNMAKVPFTDVVAVASGLRLASTISVVVRQCVAIKPVCLLNIKTAFAATFREISDGTDYMNPWKQSNFPNLPLTHFNC